MDEDWYWWKWFHVAKTEMEYWRFRCAMSEAVAGVFLQQKFRILNIKIGRAHV